MNDGIWLSIIMPIRNVQKSIEKAINSILGQKLCDIEIIVIDAASVDGTIEIIEQYSKYISYWISEPDKGYADALNKGIKKAKGEYVMMLAGDDELLPGALIRVKESLLPGTEVWCGSIIDHSELGYRLFESSENLELLNKGCSLKHPATLFKRTVFEKYGYYNVEYRCSADWELFLRYREQGVRFQIAKVPVVLFGTSGMSSTDENLVCEENKKLLLEHGIVVRTEIEHAKIPHAHIRFYGFQKIFARIGILSLIYKLLGKGAVFMNEYEFKRFIDKKDNA